MSQAISLTPNKLSGFNLSYNSALISNNMSNSFPFFQDLMEELAEASAKRGVGLVHFPAIRPFTAMSATGIPAMKLESLDSQQADWQV